MMVKNVLHIDNASKKKETSPFIGMYKGKINSKFRTKNYTALLLKPCNINFSLVYMHAKLTYCEMDLGESLAL